MIFKKVVGLFHDLLYKQSCIWPVQGQIIKTLPFEFTIRRSQRAKKTRLIVTDKKIEVVAPVRVKVNDIHLFVQAQQDWVIKAVNKMGSKQSNIKKLAPETYTHGVLIPYRGKKTKLIVQPSSKKKLQIEFKRDEFIAHVPTQTVKHDSSEMIRLALIDWMKKDALKKVEAIVEQYARLYKLTPGVIKIKTQKSRWGSCGIHNDINLNWLLVLASPEIMEYVVVHELCHIKERNHSIRFWQLVEAHLPNYQLARKWLKINGRHLMQGL